MRVTPSLPQRGRQPKGSIPLTPFPKRFQYPCPARVRRGARATPEGVGMLAKGKIIFLIINHNDVQIRFSTEQFFVYCFRYSATGISMLKFPVLIMRTCEPVTLSYAAG